MSLIEFSRRGIDEMANTRSFILTNKLEHGFVVLCDRNKVGANESDNYAFEKFETLEQLVAWLEKHFQQYIEECKIL